MLTCACWGGYTDRLWCTRTLLLKFALLAALTPATISRAILFLIAASRRRALFRGRSRSSVDFLADFRFHIACPCSFLLAFTTFSPPCLFLLSLLSSLPRSVLPRLFATRDLLKQDLVVFRLALLAEVFSWLFALGKGQPHAVVMLPSRALVATYHIPLYIFLFLILPTDAADDLIVFVAGGRCRLVGRLGRFRLTFVAGFAFWRRDVWNVEVFRVLALCCSARATRFVCLK